MIVTIDGPAAAGKSTVARALAERLGFRYLDTGAMYRAVALAGLRRGVDWNQPDQLASLAQQIRLEAVGQRILLDGEDVTEAVRGSEVTAVTRFAADNPEVRQQLVAAQRAFAAGGDVVTEGRDQGTLAFPDAECKIFLTAGQRERALRRLRDLEAQGESATLDQVLAELNRRDMEDKTRPLGALRPAADAIEVSSDGLTVQEVVDRLERIVRRCQAALKTPPPDRGRPDRLEKDPMPKKPTAVVQRSLLSRLWYAVSKQVVRSVAALVYKARYTGVESIPLTGGLLVLSNHQSHLDPPMIGCGFPRRLNFLGRKSLFVFPPFRWLIESFDAIAIDREGSPIKGLRETIRRLQGGEAVLVFPEGTRCWDGRIGPFMPGLTMMAARSGAAILPMALEGAFEAWPRTKRFPGLGRIHVHFGPPIPPEQVQAMSEEALMAETERRIRQCHAMLCARPILAGKRKRNS